MYKEKNSIRKNFEFFLVDILFLICWEPVVFFFDFVIGLFTFKRSPMTAYHLKSGGDTLDASIEMPIYEGKIVRDCKGTILKIGDKIKLPTSHIAVIQSFLELPNETLVRYYRMDDDLSRMNSYSISTKFVEFCGEEVLPIEMVEEVVEEVPFEDGTSEIVEHEMEQSGKWTPPPPPPTTVYGAIDDILIRQSNSIKRSNNDERLKLLANAINATADFATCFNDLSGCYENPTNKISSAIVEDYVQKVIRCFYIKSDCWTKQNEKLTYILLSDMISRTVEHQRRRNSISIRFLKSSFNEIADSLKMNHMELWKKIGVKEAVNDIVTLIEFNLLTATTGKDLFLKWYSNNFTVLPHPIIPILLSYDKDISQADLRCLAEDLIDKNFERSKAIATNGFNQMSSLIKMIRCLKRMTKVKAAICKTLILDISCKKFDTPIPNFQQKKPLLWWTKEGYAKYFHMKYGEGPFTRISTTYQNCLPYNYSIKTSSGSVMSFDSTFLCEHKIDYSTIPVAEPEESVDEEKIELLESS